MRIGSFIASGLFATSIALAGCVEDPSESDEELDDELSQAVDDETGESGVEAYSADPKLPAGCGRISMVCCAQWASDGHCTSFGSNYIYVAVKPGAQCPATSTCIADGGGGEQP